jgi:hypothetical protein
MHHLRIAIGSAGELATHLEVARRLQLLTDAQLGPAEALLIRVGQLLHGLLRSRRQKQRNRGLISSVLCSLAFWFSAPSVLR